MFQFQRKKQGEKTLEMKDPELDYLVQRTTKSYALPSFEDLLLVNDIYGCLGS